MQNPRLVLASLIAAAGLVGSMGACSKAGVIRPEGGDATLPADLSVSFAGDDAGPGSGGGCDDQHPCEQRLRCFAGQCIADNGTCASNDECQNDTYCDCTGGGDNGDAGPCLGGVCLPYGSGPGGLWDPSCAIPGFTADKFVAPKLKCAWMGPGSLVTTIVGDLDGDKKPEIVFASYPSGFTAIHGKDCKVYFDKVFTFAASNQSQLAIADLDGDKKPEIIGVDPGGHVVVFDNKGQLLATSPAAVQGTAWGGPAIADVDGKFPPEIVVSGQVSRYTSRPMPAITELWNANAPTPTIGSISVVADLDGDGKAEIIAGRNVYDGVTGKDKTPPVMAQLSGPGFPAIGDFNKDKKPDIVLVIPGSPQIVAIVDYANNKFLFGPVSLNTNQGGPPTVADFDGDGEPEFASAGNDNYYVFKPACLAKNKPKQCDQNSNFGLLWQKKTQDHSSGVTGSSVFDFNGDGAAEVIYRDECWLRVYDGRTGKTLFAANVTSATACELPVVADVDSDGHADLVVPSDSFNVLCPKLPEADTMTPWVGPSSGIFVYQDPRNRWMPSRAVWNEHSYHITNVNDDLTIPSSEKPNWLTYNNYRQNVQGMGQKPLSIPDFTGAAAVGVDPGVNNDCMSVWTLRAQVCNRGTATSNPGVQGTFYQDDPRGMSPRAICTTGPTQASLDPGQCEEVRCEWKSPPQQAVDLYFRSNDDGGNKPAIGECHPDNDLLLLPGATCRKIG